MKMKRLSRRAFFFGSAAVVLLILTGGCASTSGTRPTEAQAVPDARASGIVLEYKMPAGQVLKYQENSEMQQVSDIMGQSVKNTITSSGSYTFLAKGRKEKNFLLGVTIDDTSMGVTTPRGNMSPDLTSVKGKSFDMVLSPLGMEVDVSGAEAITYEFVTGKRNVASSFKIFFPVLPEKPVKVGDSWPSSYVVDEKSGEAGVRLEFRSVNTLERWETVDGMECARISAEVTGTVSGTGKQQGMDVSTEGTLKGKDVWYFAVKEGIFVKATSEVTTETTTSLTGAQTMTIPATQTRTGEVKLIGR
jgi:hypothetical protein